VATLRALQCWKLSYQPLLTPQVTHFPSSFWLHLSVGSGRKWEKTQEAREKNWVMPSFKKSEISIKFFHSPPVLCTFLFAAAASAWLTFCNVVCCLLEFVCNILGVVLALVVGAFRQSAEW